MSIVISEVTAPKELKQFVLFPNSLYAGNPCWIPPLQKDEIATLTKSENPAFQNCEARCWLAYKDNTLVGRVAGIINTAFVEKWGKRYARFGWFDFIDDLAVSGALLETVESWARQKKMEAVHGPFGFTDFDPEGMLVEGFNKIGTMTTIYNYPYYPQHVEKLDYHKDADWVEYEIEVPDHISERVKKIAREVARKSDLHVLRVKKARQLLPYAAGVFDLINTCYAELYGVVSLSKKQVDTYIKNFFQFIDPDYVSIVLQHNVVVAFAIAIPSLSKALQKAKGRLLPFGFIHLYKALHWNNAVDLYLIAVRPDLQNKGVTALLIEDLNQKFIDHHISKAITHPMLEQNGKMLSFWKYYNKILSKRRRCYIKFLTK